MIPVASFLAGSLLSLLLPVGVLIALLVWHVLAVTRLPRSGHQRSVSGSEPPPGPPPDAAGKAP